jgi:hypothetical protein
MHIIVLGPYCLFASRHARVKLGCLCAYGRVCFECMCLSSSSDAITFHECVVHICEGLSYCSETVGADATVLELSMQMQRF